MALPKQFQVEQGSSQGRYTLQKIVADKKTKVRVLSDFITGKSIWVRNTDPNAKSDRKPFRLAQGESAPVSIMDQVAINKFTGKPESWKQFIAAVVWNYADEQVEIFETDKSPLIERISELEDDEDWGDSKSYDLGITKTGTGKETRWSITPSNKASFKCPVEWKQVNLNALLSGENPFDEAQVAIQNKTDKQVAGQIYSEEAEIVADDVPF